MTPEASSPVRLHTGRVWRTYTGGRRIDALHGREDPANGNFPEDWIMSVVTANNAGRTSNAAEGLSFLAGTRVPLRDVLAADPAAMLGDRHARAWGGNPGVLLKVIDAAERLTVQAHPNARTARELFASPFGKTECWHILGGQAAGGEPPCVYLGFRHGVTRREWARWFWAQDIPRMLGALHRFDAVPGQTVLIEGGVPHAIGRGCLLLEVQEPTDLTVRVERTTPAGHPVPDALCHQGAGFSRMLDCFDYGSACAREEAVRAWFIPPQRQRLAEGAVTERLIGYDRTPCFALYRHTVERTARFAPDGAFSGLYVYGGSGSLHDATGVSALRPGDQFFLPASRQAFSIHAESTVTLFECRGPHV